MVYQVQWTLRGTPRSFDLRNKRFLRSPSALSGFSRLFLIGQNKGTSSREKQKMKGTTKANQEAQPIFIGVLRLENVSVDQNGFIFWVELENSFDQNLHSCERGSVIVQIFGSDEVDSHFLVWNHQVKAWAVSIGLDDQTVDLKDIQIVSDHVDHPVVLGFFCFILDIGVALEEVFGVEMLKELGFTRIELLNEKSR